MTDLELMTSLSFGQYCEIAVMIIGSTLMAYFYRQQIIIRALTVLPVIVAIWSLEWAIVVLWFVFWGCVYFVAEQDKKDEQMKREAAEAEAYEKYLAALRSGKNFRAALEEAKVVSLR